VTTASGSQHVPFTMARLATACNFYKVQCNVLKFHFRVLLVKSQEHLHTMVDSQYMVILENIATMLSSNATNMTCCSLLKHLTTSWLVMYLDVQCTG